LRLVVAFAVPRTPARLDVATDAAARTDRRLNARDAKIPSRRFLARGRRRQTRALGRPRRASVETRVWVAMEVFFFRVESAGSRRPRDDHDTIAAWHRARHRARCAPALRCFAVVPRLASRGHRAACARIFFLGFFHG
jgi:hypothetical protein